MADTVALAEQKLEFARIHAARGDAERYDATLEEGLALVRGSGLPIEADLLAELALSEAAAWRPEKMLAAVQEARRAARRSRTSPARAELALGQVLYQYGSRRCLHRFALARRLAHRTGDVATALEAGFLGAAGLHMLGRSAAALRLCESVGKSAAEKRKPIWERQSAWMAARIEILAFGNLALGIVALRTLVRQRGLGLQRPHVIADLALTLADTGQLDESRALLEKARRNANTRFTNGVVAFYRAEIEWASGRPARSLCAAEEALREDLPEPIAAVARITRLWSLFELGVPESDPELKQVAFSPFAGVVLENAAFEALAAGDLRLAESRFRAAATEWEGVIVRQELRALAAAGELALRRGDVPGGRALLLEVEQRTVSLGLSSVLARARRALRSLDSDRARSADRTLSPREAEILALIARGRSSKEIGAQLRLSSKTIDAHVRSAMNKLGASTRIQAAALAGLSATYAAPVRRALAPDEARLLGLLAEGLTVSEAAEALGLSRRTATRRLGRLRSRLAVATNAEAAMLSVR